MKILITGKRDRLWKAAATAFSGFPGLRATAMPVGSAVIEAVRNPSLDLVLYTLSSEEDVELLRWILRINPEIPLLAVISAKDPKFRKSVMEEGAAQVWEVSGPDPVQIRQMIRVSQLRKLEPTGTPTAAGRQISDDLHAIRSELTAILGSAELALKRSTQPAASKKPIREIPRCVAEIEKILRRLQRLVKSPQMELKRTR